MYFKRTVKVQLGQAVDGQQTPNANSRTYRFFSEDTIDADNKALYTETADKLKECFENHLKMGTSVVGSRRFPSIDIYLGVGNKKNREFRYYFVDHDTTSVFWLKVFSFNDPIFDCGVPVQSQEHLGMTILQHIRQSAMIDKFIGTIIQYFYWTHIRHFPFDQALSGDKLHTELNHTLLYGCCGQQLSIPK